MTLPSSPNLMESPVKLAQKSKTYQKAKGMPFFAFLFSIIVYISIFYIFSLSPSALFGNTKFWFVISNTLILIIAADYGAFSSSKDQKRDVYEEYYAFHSQGRRRNEIPEIEKRSIPKEEESSEMKKKEDVADEKNNEIPERVLEVVKFEPKTDKLQVKIQQEVDNKKKIEPKTIRRSKSDKAKPVAFNDKKNNLQRSKTENIEPVIAKENEFPEEENEFSTMSNEELNRRVEEFIQKFNRQIRLQGAGNCQILEYELEYRKDIL